jgi:peptidoglycan/LPS O-acetylase OafA/YrhL
MALHFTVDGGMDPMSPADEVFFEVAMLGSSGVDLFFVLSGFLITGILYDAKGGAHFFWNFYMRRLLRIFPLYYGFLAMWFFVLPQFYTWPDGFESPAANPLWSWAYLTNVIQAIEGDLAASPAYTAHFWSLAVEEQFYLLWPIVIFAFPRRRAMLICLACLVGSPLVRLALALAGNPVGAYVLMPARMDALGLGALIALAARGPNGLSALRKSAPAVAAISGAAFLATQWVSVPHPFSKLLAPTLSHSILACFFGAVLIITLPSAKRQPRPRLLCNPAFTFFGRYSYAMYVFHVPITYFMAQYVLSVPDVPALMGSQLPGQLIFIAISTAATVTLALLSWHLWEKHFLKLKGRFPCRSAARPSEMKESSQ